MTDKNPSSPAPPAPSGRKFLPQPIEVSSRSNNPFASNYNLSRISVLSDRFPEAKDQRTIVPNRPENDHSTPASSHPAAARHFPQPQEMPNNTGRSGLPQPIDTSKSSSRDKKQQIDATDESGNDSPKRKFVPEPIETTTRSSRPPTSKSAGQIAPQLVETTSDHRRRKLQGADPGKPPDNGSGDETRLPSGDHMRRHHDLPIRSGASSSSGSECSRKFSPQLIETATRSVRQKCLTRGTAQYPDHWRSSPSSASQQKLSAPESTESRFSYANILRRQEAKRHSFRVPGLPAIPSNSSEGSEKSPAQSPPTSPSTVSNNSSSKQQQDKSLLRETSDDKYSGYLQSLAARSAQRMLRDQALAAFPNEQVYQKVSHFAIDREDEDTTDDDFDENMGISLRDMKVDFFRFRRESTVDLAWELDEMRRHKEENEMRARQRMFDSGQSKYSAAAIAARQAAENELIKAHRGGPDGWQKEMGLEQIRETSSPPMLGGDIVFPQSLSPRATKCEIDQAPVSHHDNNCADPIKCEGLWSPNSNDRDSDSGGLWMGLCRRTEEPEQSPSSLPRLGIMTPAVTKEPGLYQSLDGLSSSPCPDAPSQLPTTPPPSNPDLDNVDEMLVLEQDIKREFNDAFVTQIYNYLSLGYPCLARDFDEELSKISRIPVEELRKDDKRANAKGYVGAPEGLGLGENAMLTGQCMRWTALRLYIHEWARQQPRMQPNSTSMDGWGARARRGSWAI
ncbi:hypothetical protein AJ79_03854 [Helicocarpus griseus UAMH5409]|uniref:Uncharacterized protein n=1 Tax=Helicocarpus griseus UAMH5409 TaxID=1447875 RepID=A0A2B7XXD6_9EURO|nr:hypothetical protein AJ79_03854 [Helicocarpus griseus UAMH5409]